MSRGPKPHAAINEALFALAQTFKQFKTDNGVEQNLAGIQAANDP